MKKNKILGFTLVELLVVISIISILSAISIIGLTSIRSKAQDTSKLSSIREVEIALEAYKSVNGKYADSLSSLSPTFMKNIPTPPTEYLYFVSSDQKSYCFNVRGTVYNSLSQPDLDDTAHAKSWQICRGNNTSTLSSQ